MAQSIQDYFLGKAGSQHSGVGTFNSNPALAADAAFLEPFFNMPGTGMQQRAAQGPITQATGPATSTTPRPAAVTTGGTRAAAPAPTTPPPVADPTADFRARQEEIQRKGSEEMYAKMGLDMQGNPLQQGADINSMFGIQGLDTKDMYGQFGITKPDYQAPDSQEYKDLLAKQKELSDIDRRAELEAQYKVQVENISNNYAIKREQLARDVENNRNERISSLYAVGVVNPLSSGVANIGTASQEYQDRQEILLNQQEAVEKDLAYARFFEQSTEEIERRLTSINASIKSLEDNAKAEYQSQVDEFGRSVDLVDRLVSVWKENNRISEKERADGIQAFGSLVQNFGSAAFNGMDATELANMEGMLGYFPGSLVSGIENLKKTELKNEKIQTHMVGGSLYSIERDSEGNIIPTLIIAAPAKAGGSGSSASDKDLKAMFSEASKLMPELAKGSLEWSQAYNRIAAQYPEFAVPDAAGKTIIDDALGGSAGYNPATGTFDQSKATGFAKAGDKSKKKTTSSSTSGETTADDFS
jgi:hypothetical protein